MTKDETPRVVVSQADREAAWPFADFHCLPDRQMHERWFSGYYDDLPQGSAIQAFARHRTAAEAASRAREDALQAMLVDDPTWICAGIPDAVIEAGMDAQDKVRRDMDNYVSGVTPDWDDGMVVAAIFKAMLRASLTPATGGERA